MMVLSSTWSQIIRTERLYLSSHSSFSKDACSFQEIMLMDIFIFRFSEENIVKKNTSKVICRVIDAVWAWLCWNDFCLPRTASNLLWLWRYLSLLVILPASVVSSPKANVALTEVHVVSPSLSCSARGFSKYLKQMFAFSQDCSTEVRSPVGLLCLGTSVWCK